jgi:hypothetical protein
MRERRAVSSGSGRFRLSFISSPKFRKRAERAKRVQQMLDTDVQMPKRSLVLLRFGESGVDCPKNGGRDVLRGGE